MDEDPTKDITLEIPNGKKIKKNYVGEGIQQFDSVLVLAHFKGHQMGGFGGALKQLSIGFGSQRGKTYQHTGGVTEDWNEMFSKRASQIDFTSSMADAASSVVNYFKNKKKGGLVYVNVMAKISTSCDCDYNPPVPKIRDLGMMISTDPVAIDQACLDYVKDNGEKEGVEQLFAQIERLEGFNTLKVAEELGIGTRNYELI